MSSGWPIGAGKCGSLIASKCGQWGRGSSLLSMSTFAPGVLSSGTFTYWVNPSDHSQNKVCPTGTFVWNVNLLFSVVPHNGIYSVLFYSPATVTVNLLNASGGVISTTVWTATIIGGVASFTTTYGVSVSAFNAVQFVVSVNGSDQLIPHVEYLQAVAATTHYTLFPLNWTTKTFTATSNLGTIWANPSNHSQPMIISSDSIAGNYPLGIFSNPYSAFNASTGYTYEIQIWTVDSSGNHIQKIADGSYGYFYARPSFGPNVSGLPAAITGTPCGIESNIIISGTMSVTLEEGALFI